jgi:signal transduction histidine kinase
MFLERLSKTFHSFAFYLCMGYLTVYVIGSCGIYLLSSHVITQSARGFDRQDALAESEELAEILNQNADGNWLAEEVTLGRYPPSTIFIVRIISPRGHVEYSVIKPQDVDIPEWRTYAAPDPAALPPEGWSEYYLRPLKRHLQIYTLRLRDGRVLQVGKGSFLEVDQKSMMANNLLLFMALSTVLSAVSGLFMMFITLKPINRITASMSHIIETGAFERGGPPVKSLIAELDTLGCLFTVMTQKYANLIKAMRDTMDNVAHDFRTPLARIRGASELALHDKHTHAALAETLADIIEDCDRVQLQLQNLMDAREMESGFVKLNIQPFSLTQVTSEIIDLYLLLAEEKHLTLTADFPRDEIFIEGDRHRIARAFANLVDNALKYTPKGGVVRVELECRADTIVTRVTDTGMGIPEDEQSLIWQRLFRGKKARESEKGLGLGLNIVQVIIAAHGGTIALQSALGKGTTFEVTLPKSAKNSPA